MSFTPAGLSRVRHDSDVATDGIMHSSVVCRPLCVIADYHAAHLYPDIQDVFM